MTAKDGSAPRTKAITLWLTAEEHADIARHVAAIRSADPSSCAGVSREMRELAMHAVREHATDRADRAVTAIMLENLPVPTKSRRLHSTRCCRSGECRCGQFGCPERCL